MPQPTQAQIDAASEAVRVAASKSYDQYMSAKAAYDRLVADRDASRPAVRVYVVGNTFPHRAALEALGLRWDAGHHAWVGMLREGSKLPAGCLTVSQGEAAIMSMDHADSIY